MRKHFHCYGSIASIFLKCETGEPYAYVNFHSHSHAQAAANGRNSTFLGGRLISCKAQGPGKPFFEHQSTVGEYAVKVTYISKRTTKRVLSDLFEGCDSIKIINCPKDRFNFAYVNYSSQNDAEDAVSELDQRHVNGSQIRVKLHHAGLHEREPSPQLLSDAQSLGVPSYADGPLGSRPTDDDTQSCTVKVSILGELSPEAIREVFSQFGKIRGKLYIRGKYPRYTFVSFTSPRAAEDACRLHNSTVEEVRIKVKLPSSPNQEFKEIRHIPSATKLPQSHILRISTHTSAAMTQSVKPVGHPERGLLQPADYTVGAQSCTAVKVSIFGALSAKDIRDVFSQFGKIPERLFIHGKDPRYTIINFTSPKSAADACRLHNSRVKGVKINVRVQAPQQQCPSSESREVKCNSLIASILHSKHKNKLDKLKNEHHVQISLNPCSACIKVIGINEQVTAVEGLLRNLMEKVEGDISVKDCELPSHSVPLFEQDATIEALKKIKAKHAVEFCVLRPPPRSTPIDLESFCKDVKKRFTPAAKKSMDAIPMCSELASYLKEERQCSSPNTTWFWQNDSGTGFSPYTPEVSSKFSKAFADSSSCKKFILTIGSVKYQIDLSKMTQTNIASGHSRPIRQAASNQLSTQWFYKNDEGKFVPYTIEQSAKIEHMFESNTAGVLHINRNVYKFNFTTMTQCNVVSKKTRRIERRVNTGKVDPLVKRVLTVQVSGIPTSVDLAIKELGAMVTKATVEKECQFYDDSSLCFKTKLIKNINKYFVSLDLVGECLKLKGIVRYVERVYLLAEQEKISDREQRVRDGIGGMEFQLPLHWTPQSKDVCLHAVKGGSNEWNKEVTRIHETLTNATIIKLERIQNKWLWERYSFAKKRMSKTNKEGINEKHLFHGTRDTPPEKVYRSEKGVDFRFSREGLFGTGSYFAVNASYSDSYAYTLTEGISYEKQIFICKVLTGESYNAETSDKSLRQPPLKPNPTHGSFEEECYDSVKGYTNGSHVYVVYDHEKVYPAYLVTYRKGPF